VGKGLIGLVAKPVAGTVGLVGCTVQGAVSTPGTIKRAVTKKKPNGEEHKGEEDGGMQFIDPEDAMAAAASTDQSHLQSMMSDSMSMRTMSVAQSEIDDYNHEKAQIHK